MKEVYSLSLLLLGLLLLGAGIPLFIFSMVPFAAAISILAISVLVTSIALIYIVLLIQKWYKSKEAVHIPPHELQIQVQQVIEAVQADNYFNSILFYKIKKAAIAIVTLGLFKTGQDQVISLLNKVKEHINNKRKEKFATACQSALFYIKAYNPNVKGKMERLIQAIEEKPAVEANLVEEQDIKKITVNDEETLIIEQEQKNLSRNEQLLELGNDNGKTLSSSINSISAQSVTENSSYEEQILALRQETAALNQKLTIASKEITSLNEQLLELGSDNGKTLPSSINSISAQSVTENSSYEEQILALRQEENAALNQKLTIASKENISLNEQFARAKKQNVHLNELLDKQARATGNCLGQIENYKIKIHSLECDIEVLNGEREMERNLHNLRLKYQMDIVNHAQEYRPDVSPTKWILDGIYYGTVDNNGSQKKSSVTVEEVNDTNTAQQTPLLTYHES